MECEWLIVSRIRDRNTKKPDEEEAEDSLLSNSGGRRASPSPFRQNLHGPASFRSSL